VSLIAIDNAGGVSVSGFRSKERGRLGGAVGEVTKGREEGGLEGENTGGCVGQRISCRGEKESLKERARWNGRPGGERWELVLRNNLVRSCPPLNRFGACAA
jgi:hypothetical protein